MRPTSPRHFIALFTGFILVTALALAIALVPSDAPAEEETQPTRPPTCAEQHDLPEGVSCARVQKDLALAAWQLVNENLAWQNFSASIRQAHLDELAAQEAARVSYAPSSGGGECYSRAPAGFPPGVIDRESGGDPNAYNASSGARGCAQILDSHFAPGGGCEGMSYDECWAHLWDGGAGASNWSQTL